MDKVKYKSTEKLLSFIEPYVFDYVISDNGEPSDKIDIDILNISVEEAEENSWIEINFKSIYGDLSFDSIYDEEYLQHAAELIIELLTKEIEVFTIHKGSKISLEKYSIVNDSGERRLFYRMKHVHILPGRKTSETVLYRYNKGTGRFIEYIPGMELIDVIYRDKLRVELYKKDNLFKFSIDIQSYDEYLHENVWEYLHGSGYYDSQERAKKEAELCAENYIKSKNLPIEILPLN